MTQKIKSKYSQVIEFIRRYQEETTRPPTIREIQDACGISSTSVASFYLQKGVIRGDLVKLGEPGQSRNYGIYHGK